MITKETFAAYIAQYKKMNPTATEFDLCNHIFNQGYFYGRRRKKIDKFDIPKGDWRYKTNPTKTY